MSYYCEYVKKLKNLQMRGAKVFCIGFSKLFRPIFCVKIGKGTKKLFLQGAIHAREHITCDMLFMLLNDAISFSNNGEIYCVPLSNPDGVCLAKSGLKSLMDVEKDLKECENLELILRAPKPKNVFLLHKIKKNLIKINDESKNFSLWKANICGVDLNVNFNAKWGKGKQNVFNPAPQNYVGPHPFSEPETKALASFLISLKPHMTISYHSKGEVIYYDFYQKGKQKKRDKLIAQEISKITGYKIRKTKKSSGGLKDFCIKKLKIPSLTIEVGKENLPHPISKKHLLKIYSQNKKVIQKSLALLNEINV